MSVSGSDDTSDSSVMNDEVQSLSMMNIYYLLLADLSEISNLAENARSNANENQLRQSWASFLKSQNSNNFEDIETIFKNNAVENTIKNLVDAKPLGEPMYSANVSLELRTKLMERVKKDREMIEQMTAQYDEIKNSNNVLSRRVEELQNIIAERTKSGEMKTKLQWQEVSKKIKLQRAKLVRDIRHVTDQLCPASAIPDILSETLKSYTTGKDPYITVPEESEADVEHLLRCKLISRHPHDRRQVRLCDMI